MIPVASASSPNCTLREGPSALLLLSRAELRTALCGQCGLQSITIKHWHFPWAMVVFMPLGSNHWAVYSPFNDTQTVPGTLHRTDQFYWPELLKAH